MNRRNFIKAVALGTAGSALPLSPSAVSAVDLSSPRRDPDGATIDTFSNAHRVRSGIALGGIGAGSIELRKDGRFYNWSIGNNFPKETGKELALPSGESEDPLGALLFFKVRYQVEGERPRIKLLQLNNGLNEGKLMSAAYIFPWMEAVQNIEYSARFPFGRLRFTDPDMPFDLELQAWSSFIPHNVKDSALPVAFFDFTVLPKTARRLQVLLLAAARNLTGYDLPERYHTTRIIEEPGRTSVIMSCGGTEPTASSWGEIALSALSGKPSYYAGWSHLHPYYEYVLRHGSLPNLDDTDGVASLPGKVPDWLPKTHGRNSIDPATGRKQAVNDLMCTVGSTLELDGGVREARASFLYAWNFPNLHAEDDFRVPSQRIEGHYYSNFFKDAAEVTEFAAGNRDLLKDKSREFVTNFFDSSAETFVLEQVNSQLNTFLTSGRLVKNGDFGMQEGLSSAWSWGPVATIDVMLYGTVPIIALFPELQKATMRCHAHAQGENGEIAHGMYKNFQKSEDNTAGVFHRLDLAGQFVIMATRDYFWTNDLKYLQEMYPAAQRAISYVLGHRALAGDQMPIPRGIESSYDNFAMYGYSSYILTQWLCAIASMIEGARALGDTAGETKYRQILSSGRSLFEQKLWNGRYYRLYNDQDKAGGRGDTSDACLTDQLIGQWAAHQSALGDLSDEQHIRVALGNILQANFEPGFGLRNCSWPGHPSFADVAPEVWVDQGNTSWTGVELAFASLLLYRGFYREGMEVVKAVDDRYRKNGLYWDHQEFGGHYFRPLSAWSLVNALLGLGINQGTFRFDPQLKQDSFKLFFATSTATAHFLKSPQSVRLRCLTGSLKLAAMEMPYPLKAAPVAMGAIVALRHPPVLVDDRFSKWEFEEALCLNAGEEIVFSRGGP